MPTIVEFQGKKPSIHETVYIASTASLIGRVKVSEGSSIWFGSTLRGDDEEVSIGRYVAVLENCVVEAPQGFPVSVEDEVLVSHGAILHGCVVKKNVLVGIGAVVLDGAKLGEGAIVGAGCIVPPKTTVPPRTLVLGIPAKPARKVGEGEVRKVVEEARLVAEKAKKYRESETA